MVILNPRKKGGFMTAHNAGVKAMWDEELN